ncbi:MAG: hypothetical protein ACE5OQ_07540, partial [Woeseia sp.]
DSTATGLFFGYVFVTSRLVVHHNYSALSTGCRIQGCHTIATVKTLPNVINHYQKTSYVNVLFGVIL